MQKVNLVGYVGQDATTTDTKKELIKRVDFSICCTRRNADEEVKTWFNITHFCSGKIGPLIKKGMQLSICGNLQIDEVTKNEVKKTYVNVLATEVILPSQEKTEDSKKEETQK